MIRLFVGSILIGLGSLLSLIIPLVFWMQNSSFNKMEIFLSQWENILSGIALIFVGIIVTGQPKT